MEETCITNYVSLCGEMAETPTFSHESRGERYYRFPLAVSRLSGAVDTLPILARSELLDELEITGDPKLALARYFAQPQHLELRQYRESSVTLCRAAFAAAAALALLAAAYLAGGEPLWALPALAAAATSAAAGLSERRLAYPLEKAGDDSADT